MLLLDMTDLTSDNSNLSQTKELLKALQNFYPAYTYKIFVINGGLLIRSIYFAIKGLLKQRVKDRVILIIN
jgi:CRAL/TRIO domain.